MKKSLGLLLLPVLFLATFSTAWADEYTETKQLFEKAGVGEMFKSAHGYALFPTIGKAGFVVGGAAGDGRVYRQGTHIGNVEMSQLTVGVQLGAVGFSQLIFFENEAALTKFTSGSYEFGVKVQAVALTASADASAGTGGSSATASGTKNAAIIEGDGYQDGMAIFTLTKGGLMYEASVGGQSFTYQAL